MMTAKKKTTTAPAQPKAGAVRQEAARVAKAGHKGSMRQEGEHATPKPIGVGDWVMLDGMFEQLHLVAKGRDKEVVTTACGLAVAPSFTKPKAQRCKRCNALRDVTAS